MDAGRIKRGLARRAGRATGQAIERVHLPIEVRGRGSGPGRTFATVEELCDAHFSKWAPRGHSNRQSLQDTLLALGGKPATILETGSSAWGTNSSQLFDAYVASFGGEFATVDLRVGPLMTLRPALTPSSSMACMDSVRFLNRWTATNPGRRADLVYLDSWDLVADDPIPSAIHGLNELLAVRPALRDGSLLLVDDSPASVDLYPEAVRNVAAAFAARHGMLPGKAMLIDAVLARQTGVEKIHHGYQVLYRFA